MFAIFPKSPAGVTLRCELFDEIEIEEEEYESVVKSDKRAVWTEMVWNLLCKFVRQILSQKKSGR